MNVRYLAAGLLSLVALSAPLHAQQPFPSRPIRVISPFPTGSGPDVVVRVAAEKMSRSLGQTVIIEARPGGNGFIALEGVKRAAPTGYELGLADVGHLAINPSLFKKLPYDAQTDFTQISGVYRTAFFVFVGQNSPIRDIRGLLAEARQHPGKVTYGSNSVGGPLHLGAVQLETAAGVRMLHVPFKETAAVYNAVATGDVTWAMGSLATAGPLLQAGKLRLLAVADKERSAAMPDVPTVEQSGGPAGVEATTWVTFLGPRDLPPAIAETLSTHFRAALDSPDVRDRMTTFGFAPAGSTGAQVMSWMRADTPRYADMIKRTGAQAD
jgi:tripartite-type tricarboxylate transporter receptor subunit TctC